MGWWTGLHVMVSTQSAGLTVFRGGVQCVEASAKVTLLQFERKPGAGLRSSICMSLMLAAQP